MDIFSTNNIIKVNETGDIIIRKALEADIETIAALERATSATAWSEASIRNDVIENDIACVLVAVVDSTVVGYADTWNIAGELQLNNIAVNTDYRRRHIGESLLNGLIEIAGSNCETMNLEVRKSNEAAIGLYRKLGFEIVGERPGYYENNGETAVLMDKNLEI